MPESLPRALRALAFTLRKGLQGAVGSLRGIAALIGPALFTLTFSAFVGALRAWNLPGAPWLLAALLLAAVIVPAWRITRPESEPPVAVTVRGLA